MDRYEELKRSNPLPSGFADLVNGFAEKGFDSLLGQSQNSNVVYSPVCLLLAIGMLMSSSEKEAAREIWLQLERCSGSANLSFDELEEGFSALVKHIGANPLADVRTACAAWLAKSVASDSTDKDTLDKLARLYESEVHDADFGSREASAEIRDWIGSKTEGMLKPEVQTNASMLAILVSCLYARLSWSREFYPDETEWGHFFTMYGEAGDARFMHEEFPEMSYYDGEDYTRVTLSCEGGYSVDFLMPCEPEDLSNPEYVRSAFATPDNDRADVELYLPKFEVETDVDGKRLLNSMHMNSVFKAQDNCPLVGGPLQIDNVVHGAKVKVDESGLEGAAYTMVVACAGALPEREPLRKVRIRFDRPFAFRVVTDDHIPLFMGCISDPTAPARERFFESKENRAMRDGKTDPSQRLKKVELGIGSFFGGWKTYTLFENGKLERTSMLGETNEDGTDSVNVGPKGFDRICRKLGDIGVFGWDEEYSNPWILDGEQWSLNIEDIDGATFSCSGSNEYPQGFDELCHAMGIDR